MKQKVFYAMASAALLAACSQEDLVSIESSPNSKADLTNRISLGKVELGTDNSATRGVVKDGHSYDMVFAKGDAVGAVLIDKVNYDAYGTGYNSNKKKWDSDIQVYYGDYLAGARVKEVEEGNAKFYYSILTDQVASNYEYKYDENTKKFRSEATLVEGNYMFYSPFNKNLQTRGLVKVVFPTKQDCSETADANTPTTYLGQTVNVSAKALNDFYSNQNEQISHVGYSYFQHKNGEKINASGVKLYSLYSTPTITVKYPAGGIRLYDNTASANDNTGTAYTGKLTIEQVMIYDAAPISSADPKVRTDAIFESAYLDNAQVALIGTNNWKEEATDKGQAEGLTGVVLEEYSRPSGNLTISSTKHYDQMPTASITNTVKNNRITCTVGKELNPGGMYHFNAILPAANFGTSGDLKAKVYVKTEDGTRYVMTMANVYYDNVYEGSKVANAKNSFVTVPTAVEDYVFEDPAKSPGAPVITLRGWNIPSAELNTTTKSKKSFAGQMMTINLGKTANVDTDAKTQEVYVGFKLHKEGDGEAAVEKGFTTTDDFIYYLQNEVGAGISLAEDKDVNGIDKSEWGSKIAFKSGNTVTINADLIRALQQGCYQSTGVGDVLTLTTNLPIGTDVKVEVKDASTNTYKFTTIDGVTEYLISYKNVNSGLNAKGALYKGITVLDGACEIKEAAEGGSVLFLGSNAYVTIKNATNLRRIICGSKNPKLNVQCSLGAVIEASKATITVGNNGALTGKNIFSPQNFGEVTITNNSLKQISYAGTDDAYKGKVTVKAAINGFQNIPSNALVNELTVNLTGNTVLTSNLVNGLNGLRSSSSVTVNSAAQNSYLYIVEDLTVGTSVAKFLTDSGVKFNTESVSQLTVSFSGIKASNSANVTVGVAAAAAVQLKYTGK